MNALKIALAAALLAGGASPALAQWRLVDPGETREVAGSGLVVTAPAEWNRATQRPTRRTEIWTKDGNTLGELDFWLGIKDGDPIFLCARQGTLSTSADLSTRTSATPTEDIHGLA